MKTINRYHRFYRSAGTLHRSTCPRVNVLSKLLRKVTPWSWADGRPDREIVRAVKGLKLKPCRACRPFFRGETHWVQR